jgi:hypothetical protein
MALGGPDLAEPGRSARPLLLGRLAGLRPDLPPAAHQTPWRASSAAKAAGRARPAAAVASWTTRWRCRAAWRCCRRLAGAAAAGGDRAAGCCAAGGSEPATRAGLTESSNADKRTRTRADQLAPGPVAQACRVLRSKNSRGLVGVSPPASAPVSLIRSLTHRRSYASAESCRLRSSQVTDSPGRDLASLYRHAARNRSSSPRPPVPPKTPECGNTCTVLIGRVSGCTVSGAPSAAPNPLAMAFKLIESAQDRWRAVNAPHLVALVRAGATFINGKLVERPGEKAKPEAA